MVDVFGNTDVLTEAAFDRELPATYFGRTQHAMRERERDRERKTTGISEVFRVSKRAQSDNDNVYNDKYDDAYDDTVAAAAGDNSRTRHKSVQCAHAAHTHAHNHRRQRRPALVDEVRVRSS